MSLNYNNNCNKWWTTVHYSTWHIFRVSYYRVINRFVGQNEKLFFYVGTIQPETDHWTKPSATIQPNTGFWTRTATTTTGKSFWFFLSHHTNLVMCTIQGRSQDFRWGGSYLPWGGPHCSFCSQLGLGCAQTLLGGSRGMLPWEILKNLKQNGAFLLILAMYMDDWHTRKEASASHQN